jgi:protein-L-isoaspartate(D-aspartate) O-methyltransferase
MDYRISREKMVREQIIGRGIKDENVIQAMREVPRHLFVEEALWSLAYSDRSLPIGEKQTISQPFIVGLMIEAVELQPGELVLEIGSGSGYQTAVLARMASKVYSLERIPSLLIRARRVLDEIGTLNVVMWQSDGTKGWKRFAPYDAIIVSAGGPEIPEPLLDQLADGGRLVAPVGDASGQDLIKVVRRGEEFTRTSLGPCRFVKLVGAHGWRE